MTDDAVELKRQNLRLKNALVRCDEAAQRFWKSKTSISAAEELEVIEAGREAHVTLLDIERPVARDARRPN